MEKPIIPGAEPDEVLEKDRNKIAKEFIGDYRKKQLQAWCSHVIAVIIVMLITPKSHYDIGIMYIYITILFLDSVINFSKMINFARKLKKNIRKHGLRVVNVELHPEVNGDGAYNYIQIGESKLKIKYLLYKNPKGKVYLTGGMLIGIVKEEVKVA